MEGHSWPFSQGKQPPAALPRSDQWARRQADWRRLVQTAGHRTPRTPGSEISRTGCPWSRGDSGTAGGGGTCRRSGTEAWRCRTPELRKTQGEKGREDGGGWLMGRRRAKKTDRQFYGFMHNFGGTKGSRKILAKQRSKQTVAAMRWNEWAGNQRLPAHCETRRLRRTTISSCYILLLKNTHRNRRHLVPPLL